MPLRPRFEAPWARRGPGKAAADEGAGSHGSDIGEHLETSEPVFRGLESAQPDHRRRGQAAQDGAFDRSADAPDDDGIAPAGEPYPLPARQPRRLGRQPLGQRPDHGTPDVSIEQRAVEEEAHVPQKSGGSIPLCVS